VLTDIRIVEGVRKSGSKLLEYKPLYIGPLVVSGWVIIASSLLLYVFKSTLTTVLLVQSLLKIAMTLVYTVVIIVSSYEQTEEFKERKDYD
jgi:hypothetical protein